MNEDKIAINLFVGFFLGIFGLMLVTVSSVNFLFGTAGVACWILAVRCAWHAIDIINDGRGK